MGTHFVEYRGHGFWSWHGYFEHLMAALADTATRAGAQGWLAEAVEDWRLCARNDSGCATPNLDRFLTTDEHRDVVLRLLASVRGNEDATRELRESCDLLAQLLRGELQTDASSPLTYLVSGEHPYLWHRDLWDEWRDGLPSISAVSAGGDTSLPIGGTWYIAEILYARPLEPIEHGFREEICHLMVHAIDPAAALEEARTWGQLHAAKAPEEVWLLAVSHLRTIGDESNLLTSDQLTELEWVRDEIWPNSRGEGMH